MDILFLFLVATADCIFSCRTKCFFSPFLSPTDPSLPFLPSNMEDAFVFSGGHVENIIPCRVTDPNTPVTLYEKRIEDPVPATYNPRQGFKGLFEDMAYICRATLDGQDFDSIPYYVYIIQGELLPNMGWAEEFIF